MKSLNIKLRIEYFFLGLRDKFGIPFKPEEEIHKLGLKEGQKILDYGCGIGSYTFPAANLVGEKGRVYALDKQPLAIKKIKEKAQKEGFYNIGTILSDGDTGLPNESVDVILLYGVLHEVKHKEPLLKELYRILKPNIPFHSFLLSHEEGQNSRNYRKNKVVLLKGAKGSHT